MTLTPDQQAAWKAMDAIDLLGLETASEYLKLRGYPELSRIVSKAHSLALAQANKPREVDGG